MSINIRKRIHQLYDNGFSFRKIAKQLKKEKLADISKSTVARFCSNEQTQKIGKTEIEKNQNHRKESSRPTLAKIITTINSDRYDEELEEILGNSELDEHNNMGTLIDEPQTFLDHLGRRTIQVEADPIIRKVAFTPKTLLLYQWVRSEYNWDGTLSDFVGDCVEYFFKEHLKVDVGICS